MDLSGKRAVVTGGSSGIGLATVQMLHGRGASVTVLSRNPERAKEEVPNGVSLVACDVRDREGLQDFFKSHGPVDALVCAATGGSRSVGPFLEMDLDGYQASFDKLWGYTNTVRIGGDHLTEKAAIVLVSGAPARRARKGQVSLASAGGAVEAFCRTVAPEIAPRRINVVSPGLIATPMFGDTPESRQSALEGPTSNHLIPRPGTPEEAASAIVFLLENDFVTGTTIDVDGGWLLT